MTGGVLMEAPPWSLLADMYWPSNAAMLASGLPNGLPHGPGGGAAGAIVSFTACDAALVLPATSSRRGQRGRARCQRIGRVTPRSAGVRRGGAEERRAVVDLHHVAGFRGQHISISEASDAAGVGRERGDAEAQRAPSRWMCWWSTCCHRR